MLTVVLCSAVGVRADVPSLAECAELDKRASSALRGARVRASDVYNQTMDPDKAYDVYVDGVLEAQRLLSHRPAILQRIEVALQIAQETNGTHLKTGKLLAAMGVVEERLKAARSRTREDIELPKPVAKETRVAWVEAGATVGWASASEGLRDLRFNFTDDAIGEPRDITAFKFEDGDEAIIPKLPVPREPFGLQFSGRNITDAGLRNLAGLKSLQRLSLDSTQITDAGLEHLAGLAGLQWLSLAGTNVTGAGLKHLTGVKNLQVLSAPDSLTDLDLPVIATHRGLRFVHLQWCPVTDDGLKCLAELKDLECLDLSDTKVTGSGFKHLTGLTALRTLKLAASGADDAGLKHLGGFKGLRVLDLRRNTRWTTERPPGDPVGRITDAGIAHLAGLTNLVELELDDAAVTDEGLRHLAGMKNLQTLSLRGPKITDAGLKHLTGLKHLEELYLGGARVTKQGVAELKKALPECYVYGF